mgnify:CR=1 FL=1
MGSIMRASAGGVGLPWNPISTGIMSALPTRVSLAFQRALEGEVLRFANSCPPFGTGAKRQPHCHLSQSPPEELVFDIVGNPDLSGVPLQGILYGAGDARGASTVVTGG